MNKLIKSMIPKGMKSSALKMYWRFYWRLCNGLTKAAFSLEKHDELRSLNCIVSYNKYGCFCVPKSSLHRTAAKKILSGKVHEPKTIEYIVSNCGSGDIIHAGAYFGDFLPALSKGIAPSSRIWAFEPNPENYCCARMTLEINGIKNVVLTKAGLGAKQESLLMKMTDESGRSLGGASQIISEESAEVAGVEAVQIVRVDTTVGANRNVSIIQLDVEGHEKEALMGALKTIQSCFPIIILENLPNSTLIDGDWFGENILSLGYRKVNHMHGNLVFVCEVQHC